MKFDRMRSAGRGLSVTLRNDAGEAVGMISSCFVSASGGAFCRTYAMGYLTATASVFDLKSGESVEVATFSHSLCRLRVEADKVFRDWLRKEDMREKLIVAALDFESKRYDRDIKLLGEKDNI